ncbi:hypothetical protein [Roseococcus sp. YIM B11640]|uniref:hypothetical protein n=1 Tax=Roseococcus sp. YIM B11640 TaxID=3133973 RepID=UPI003C7B4670
MPRLPTGATGAAAAVQDALSRVLMEIDLCIGEGIAACREFERGPQQKALEARLETLEDQREEILRQAGRIHADSPYIATAVAILDQAALENYQLDARPLGVAEWLAHVAGMLLTAESVVEALARAARA